MRLPAQRSPASAKSSSKARRSGRSSTASITTTKCGSSAFNAEPPVPSRRAASAFSLVVLVFPLVFIFVLPLVRLLGLFLLFLALRIGLLLQNGLFRFRVFQDYPPILAIAFRLPPVLLKRILRSDRAPLIRTFPRQLHGAFPVENQHPDPRIDAFVLDRRDRGVSRPSWLLHRYVGRFQYLRLLLPFHHRGPLCLEHQVELELLRVGLGH